MPGKLLLQLRLLNPNIPASFGRSAMSLSRPMLPVPSSSFCRVFPFRLKYHSLALHRRRFSTRPGSSRSLVDDEAELSDWVSDLRGSHTAPADHSAKRRRSAESDSDAPSERRMNRQFDSRKSSRFSRSSEPSKRDHDGDDRKKGLRFQEERNSFSSDRRFRGDEKSNSFSRNSRSSRRFGDDSDSGVGEREFSPRKSTPRFQSSARTGGRGGERDMNREFSPRDGSSRFQSTPKRGGRRGDRDLERDFSPRESSPRFQSTASRGRDMEFGYKNGGADSRKQVALVSEDDDDEDEAGIDVANKFGIGDLLSDDESETDEEEDGEDVANLLAKENGQRSPARASPGESESYLSNTRFDECSVSPLSLKGIKDAGYEKMTIVQEATLPLILKGKDVLAKAKTGTGKTVAFLLPSVEVVVNSPPVERDQKRPPILVLVICPTRELACQAAAEANTLLKYHPSIGVQVVIGGTRLALEQKRMQANPCQILVATPGRLRDHMENTAGFATRLMGVKVLVLDEADHLLDMGFRKDIERIIAAVPKQRQTLLFSATVPEEVRQVCHIALKRDHEFINTVQGGSEDTHSQVNQMYLVAPLDKQFSLLYALLKEHIADDVEYKVIVFCTTAMLTKLVAELLSELKVNVREIHSRKSQSYRTKVSDEFRKSKGLVLATSDVSARGVDYPDVTLVIQLGLPADKQQYIHRLGRTGRKGKEGEGILLLAPWEEFFLSSIKDLPISKATEPSIDPDTKKKVERGLSHVEMKSKEAAYQAWLGYYNSNKTIGRDKYKLVELANEFSRSMGLDNPPAIPKLVLGKMGLKNIPGLRVR